MFDLLKKTPLYAIGALIGAQLAAMVPFIHDGKIRPLFFVYLDEISLLDLTPTFCFAAGHAMAVTALLLIARMVTDKWGLRIAGAFVGIHFLGMIIGVLYYGNFGQYPRATLLTDLMITPQAVIGYGITGATPSDYVFGTLAAALVVLITIKVVSNIQRNPTPGDACFLSTAMAIAFLTVGISLVSTRGALGALRVSQFHGTPTSLIWGTLSDSIQNSPRNQPECAIANLPIPSSPMTYPKTERPAHIILVVMESFRADHLPLYGYSRNTMPRLQSSANDWTVFSNYRSAAPMTAASLRAILSSQYLQLGFNENLINNCVQTFWKSLSAAGYKTAFLTGADMRWHYLDNVTQAKACDDFLHFYAVDQASRDQHILRDRIDGSLNDAFVIDQTAQRLKQSDAAKTPTFSVLYLLNLHQPYYSDPEDREFVDADLPTVVADKRILQMELSESHRVSLNNQYDNSIVNFDKNLSILLDALRENEILERSVVMITGDHGEAFGEHGTYYHGTTVYDEQIKVPLMIRVGAKLPKLRTALEANRQTVATGVDLSPTILAIAGGEIPAALEGTPLTAKARKNYDFVFWTAGYQMAAVVTKTQKFIYDMETRLAQGFDLSRDPEEIVNTLDGKFEDFSSFLEHLEQTQVIQRVPDSGDQRRQAPNQSVNQVKHSN